MGTRSGDSDIVFHAKAQMEHVLQNVQSRNTLSNLFPEAAVLNPPGFVFEVVLKLNVDWSVDYSTKLPQS